MRPLLRTQFDAKTIDDFCAASGDSNAIHDSKIMHGRGLYPIVPAMLTLCTAIAEFSNKYPSLSFERFSLDAYLGNPFCENEMITIGEEKMKAEGKTHRIYAISESGADNLSNGKGVTTLTLGDAKSLPDPTDLRGIDIAHFSYARFKEIVVLEDSPLSSFLYTLSCQSRALLYALEDPRMESEKMVKSLMEKGNLPVYTHIFAFSDGAAKRKQEEDLSYHLKSWTEGKRSAIAEIRSGGFYSRSEISLVPEGIIQRMAKKMAPLSQTLIQ